MRENLMTVSPAGIAGAEEDIFSFDATEAAVAGMCEMLLQSSLTPNPSRGGEGSICLQGQNQAEELTTPLSPARGAGGEAFLTFLPALPKAWAQGEVKGICARGGIEADFTWKDGKVTTATLRSKNDQTVKVNINGKQLTIQLKAGRTTKVI